MKRREADLQFRQARDLIRRLGPKGAVDVSAGELRDAVNRENDRQALALKIYQAPEPPSE